MLSVRNPETGVLEEVAVNVLLQFQWWIDLLTENKRLQPLPEVTIGLSQHAYHTSIIATLV